MAKMTPSQFYSSHRNDTHGGASAPVEPHMMLGLVSEQKLAIPKGAHLFIVRDPRHVDGVFEYILKDIKFKNGAPVEIHFLMPVLKGPARKVVATLAYHGDPSTSQQRVKGKVTQPGETPPEATDSDKSDE